jgi:hypothetical protein
VRPNIGAWSLKNLAITIGGNQTRGHVSQLNFVEVPSRHYVDFFAHPGTDVSSFCSDLIDTGYSRIPSIAPTDGTSSGRIIEDHLHLLEVSDRIVKEVIKSPAIQRVSAPMLLHPDFTKGTFS